MDKGAGRGVERGLVGCARRAGGRASAVVAALGLILLTFIASFGPASFQFVPPAFAATLQANAVAASVPPPTLVGAVSRKVHGVTGTFDLALSPNAATPTVEPRQGTTATIVFTFDKPVTAAIAAVTEGVGTAGLPTISGNDVTVGLTGVTNAQWVTVTLTDVTSADGGTGGAAAVRIGFLLGDVSGNRVVTVADLGQVNAQIAQVVGAGNFLRDVNASGTLTVADKGIANTQITKALAAPGNVVPAVNAGADQVITLPANASLNGTASDDGLPSPPGAMSLNWTKVSGPGTVTFDSPASVTTTASFDAAGTYVLRLTASDGSLVASDDVQVTVQQAGGPPTLNAPPVDTTVASSVFDATAFLYTGPNAVQSGVAPGTIDAKRVVVLRGRVIDRGGAPLNGVTVKVNGRAQFGQTLTRADGRYDMAVNGGDVLTLDFSKTGLLPVQRTQNTPWRRYVNLPDVTMIGLDTAVTAVTANGATMQVHQGSVQTDASGSRRATLLFPAGTAATLHLPGGGTQPLASLTVRATEYTVGPGGPSAMPGALPETSAYTYAVELSVDEAIAAGAKRVQFSQPVPFYVENFLGFPAGTVVPSGFYDREQARWIAAPNGRVVKIVTISGGAADLDVTGDDFADDPVTVLASLGITLEERQRLATLYVAGQSLWRVPVDHFTPGDLNYPVRRPADARRPEAGNPQVDGTVDCGATEVETGSVAECQNQTVGQTIGLVGTPYTLNYRSDRVPGRQSAFALTIPASGASMPASAKRIEVDVTIAGQRFVQTLSTAPNQKVSIAWDGKDVYGRTVQGRQAFDGSVRYFYDAEYLFPFSTDGAFGAPGNSGTGVFARVEYDMKSGFEGALGVMDARGYAVGGWTLSHHHAYDPLAQTLYLGDGRRVSAGPVPLSASLAAGGGTVLGGTGIPALQARFQLLDGPAIAGDGSVYVSDRSNHRLYRIDPSGMLTLLAGTGVAGTSGDGGPAINAQLSGPSRIALGPDGSVFFSEDGPRRVRRIDPAGIITTVAGGGAAQPADGVPATTVALFPEGLTVAPDGSFYVASYAGNRVFRVGTDGLIYRVAGGGATGTSQNPPNNIPARDANLTPLYGGLALDAAGNLYITFNQHVARVDPGGLLTLVVGPVNGSSLADGVHALEARLSTPEDITVGPDGALHITDSGEGKVRRVALDGRITTLAGGGTRILSASVNDIPAKQANLSAIRARVAPDGTLRIIESRTGAQARQQLVVAQGMLPATSGAPISVASVDGTLLYQFDEAGRHLRTLNALTGAELHVFGYDSSGRLTAITEKTGGTDNVTTIQRNGSGQPTAIVGPYGHSTGIQLDGNGFVSRITTPAGEAHDMTYTADGLLRFHTAPGNRTSQYHYDAGGRLIQADDAAGGTQAFVRVEQPAGREVTRTTLLGRATKYVVDERPTGETRLTTVAPDTTQAVTDQFENGTHRLQPADGSITTVVQGADPRFGSSSPVVIGGSTVMPGGLTLNHSGNRTATLAVPGNPFSLTTLVDTATVNGRTTTATYTAATRTNVVVTAVGRTSTTVHDVLGRVTSTQATGLAPTTYTYDARGRLQTIVRGTAPNTRALTLTYNAAGNVQSVTDATGRTTQYTYDANDRPTSKTLLSIGTVAMTYDAAGDLASIAPPGRPPHALAYDARGNLTAVTPPAVPGSGPATFAYDADGDLASVTRPGETVTFGYDAFGRMTSIATTQPSLAAQSVTFGYDTAGRIATLTGPGTQVVSNGWNGPLLTSVTWSGPFASSVSWTYDASFRPTGETIPGSGTLAYTWDNDDLPTGVGGLVIGRSAQNGLATGATLGTLAETYGYNAFGEVTSRTLTAAGVPVHAATYTRDAAGRVVQKQETIGGVTDTFVYAYDALGQLLQVTRNGAPAEAYVYDANGNRISATVGGVTTNATYDVQDRLLSAGTTTSTHSPAGKLQRKAAAGGNSDYRYDALGNLIDVVLPSGTTVAYRLDGWDRRVQRLVNGAVVAQYVRSGDRILAELDGVGTLVSRFGYVTGEVPAIMLRGGLTYRFVSDANGSVRLVVNAATGDIAQRLDYDGFGRVVVDTNPGFQPFGFAGGHYDPATGLTRFGARDYDAEAGRWTTRDPIGFTGGDTNFYRYARNDPVNLTDPSGLITFDDVMNFAAGAVEAGAAAGVFHNPVTLLGVAADGIVRGVSSALGYPQPGPSLWDSLTKVDTMSKLIAPSSGPLVDRSSNAYLAGEITTGVGLMCVGGGLALGEKLSEVASKRALQRVADDIARDVAEAPARRAAKAAADLQARKLADYARNKRGLVGQTGQVKQSSGFIKPKAGGG